MIDSNRSYELILSTGREGKGMGGEGKGREGNSEGL